MSASSSTTRILPLGVVRVASSGAATSGIHRVPLRFARAGRDLGPRKLEVKTGSAARPAEDLDGAAMFLNDTVGDRKTQPGALARGFGGKERIVDAIQVLGR